MLIKKSTSNNPPSPYPPSHSPAKESAFEALPSAKVASGEWYQTLGEQFSGLYFAMDSSGIIYFVNQLSANSLGYSPEELISRPIFNLFLPEDQLVLSTIFSTFVQQSDSEQVLGERCLVRRDGSFLRVKAIVQSLPPPNWEEKLGGNKTESILETPPNHSLDNPNKQPFYPPTLVLSCEEIENTNGVYGSTSRHRLRQQTEALKKLAQFQPQTSYALENYVREITEVAVRILDLEGASIWLYRDDRSVLTCIDSFQSKTQQHSVSSILTVAECPACFQAFNSPNPAIASQTRISRFAPGDSSSESFSSLLTLPIFLADETIGILVLEGLETVRDWTSEDEHFSHLLVDFLAIALELVPQFNSTKNNNQDIINPDKNNLKSQLEPKKRESKTQFVRSDSDLFTGGPAIVFCWKAAENWPVEYVSPNVVQLGYQVSDFISQSVLYANIVHPDDLTRVKAEVEAYSESNVTIFEQDYRLIDAKGESRWIYDYTRIIRNSSGKITHYEGYILDITDRKQAEAELERSFSLLQATLESTADGILAVSTQGETVCCNQKYLQMWRISEGVQNAKQLETRLVFLASQLLDPESFIQTVKELYSQPEAVQRDILYFKDGRIIERYTQPTRVGNTIMGRVWCFRDITEYKRAEATLRDSERRFRAVFNSSFQLAGLLKPEGDVLEVNQTALDFAEIALSDVVGHPLWETYWWRISHTTQENLKIAIATAAKGEFVRYEAEILGAAGRVATLDFSIKPIRDDRGQVALLIAEGRDITESKQAQLALRQQAERERVVGQMQARIRSSLNLQEILNTAVAEVRQFLQTDRVVIYRFHQSDWSGEVVVESVGPQWVPILTCQINDLCFRNHLVDPYKRGRIRAVEDIYTSGLSRCHIKLLETYQVRANLIVPIIHSHQTLSSSPSDAGNDLWGLLIAHNCSGPRQWQTQETELLKQLAMQMAIAIKQSQLYQQLEAANQELEHLASLDGLTKIANRRRFDEVLSQEWQRLRVEPGHLSLILCDIDCFKTYNDTYGHQAGDACLLQVATGIREACRHFPSDRLYLVARYGGEEFAIILPNTDLEGALAVAEEIRRQVKTLAIVHEKSFVSDFVTLSLGVACASTAEGEPEVLVAEADRALYQAKSLGRDRVVGA